jgi:hypothetical protein
MLLAIGIASAFSTPAAAAIQAPSELLKVKPSTIYHAICGKSLATTLDQVAQRSGIVFKINTDLSNDLVSQSIAADNWASAIKSLLAGYNFSTIQDGDMIKTVIISGRNSNGPSVITAQITNDQSGMLVISPKVKSLPNKYRDLPAGSVTAIDFPIAELMARNDSSAISVDLPIGQYTVAHTRTVKEDDGSKTWVGYLSDQGEGYRVFLSKGAGGTMGVLTTPDGTYNIETDKTGTYLVDTSKLTHAGFEGDTTLPSETTMDAKVAKATQSQIDLSQAAVTKAKTILDAANAIVTKYTNTLKNYKLAYTAATTGLNSANTTVNTAKTAYNDALATYNASKTSTNAAKVNTASKNYSLAVKKYNAAVAVLNKAAFNVNSMTNTLAAKTTDANKAKSMYDFAVKALADAKAAIVTVTASTVTTTATDASTPVVDIMVVYSTGGYSADFAKQRIALLTTASNQAYLDSGINLKLRLVYTEATNYVEDNSNNQALSDLANDRGAFAGIAQKRAQYGADLVFLFRPLYAQSAGSCGTTYLEFKNGNPANSNYGYGVISDGNSKDSATSTYCGANTYTHEIGHSLGLVHDREYSQSTGVFPYSYAWGVSGSFATIMSYKQPVLMYFSTPTLATQCAGQPCGYAATDPARSSDQTKSVNYTAPIVANFMPTLVNTPILK